jgi:RimJ/RimL family protein N-acetyltransferase
MIITLRKLQVGERRDLLAVIDAVCGEGKWMTTRQYEPTPAWEHALDEVDCPEHLLLVATTGSHLVGWCRSFPSSHPNGQIATLGVGLLPAFRDQGIGTQMVRTALAWAQEAGLKQICLTARSDNERAIHVFAKCGFTPLDNSPRKNGKVEMAIVLGE